MIGNDFIVEMPVLKHIIEPKYVSRRVVPPNTSNELEFISNSTLAHVIFQLSSLSKHSEDLFGELHRETCCILYRTSQLNERIEHLKMKIVRLNPTVEEVSLHDINMRKPFKSSVMKENQIIGVNTRPHAISEVYRWVEPAPALHILNSYREDGKESLKFYTDPGYFFELWSLEITKDAENQVKRHKHRKGRAMRPPKEASTLRQPKIHHDSSKDHLSMLQRPDSADGLHRAHTMTPVDQRKSLQQMSSPSKKMMSSLPKVQRGSSQGRYDRASITSSHQSSPASASPRHTKSQFVYPNGSYEVRDDRIKDHASPRQQIRQVVPPVDRPPGSPHPPSGGVQQLNRTNPDRNVYREEPTRPPNATLPLNRTTDQGYSIHKHQMPATLDRSFDHDHVAMRQRLQEQDSPRIRARDSVDLPPPPLTPPAELPQSYEPMPSPPPMPPPVLDYPPSSCPILGSPLLPPPPLLYDADFSLRDEAASVGFSSRRGSDKCFRSGDGSVDDDNNTEEDAGQTGDGNDAEGDRDHRSDLLAAIKKGIQLRKVEEQRLKTAHMQKMPASQGHLDVQSIMEAAFEMRRKALEENDDDDEDDDDDEVVNNWSDEN